MIREDSFGKDKAKKVWRKIFGLEIGTRVRLFPWLWKDNPFLYIWESPHTYNPKDVQKIPVEKFVGVIVGKSSWDENSYRVKWIADSRNPSEIRCFIWREGIFEIIEEGKKREDKKRYCRHQLSSCNLPERVCCSFCKRTKCSWRCPSIYSVKWEWCRDRITRAEWLRRKVFNEILSSEGHF